MDVCISSGHGLKVRGAKGHLDEVDEARMVTDRVAELLRSAGVGVKVFHDNTSTSVSANLSAIVNYHNAQKRDRDVSVHFNAFQTTTKAMGAECLYTSQTGESIARQVSASIASAGGFINRGPKKRTDLAFLNKTAKPAVLLEVCFVDSSADANLYRRNFEPICRAIAEAIGGVKLPTEPPPVEPPEPELPSGRNVVDVSIDVKGDALVTINGDPVNATAGETANRVALTLEHDGDIIVTINGEDFQIAPSIWFKDIIATVFGGASDPNNSAYPPYDKITDTEKSVALPFKFTGTRPNVRVVNPETGKEVICTIRDVGPWLIDDDYWTISERPLAEACFKNDQPLPRGPHKGKKGNGAGIDLTPAAAREIGLVGKGAVDWTFADDNEGV